MSTNVTGDVPQVPADPVPAQTPTITHYQQIAENLAKAIDDMLALIPTFVEAHPDTTVFVNRHQNVPLQFIATAAAAVEANPELRGGTFDATEARDALQFIDAFRPMADRLAAAAKNLTFSIKTRKANAGNGALEVYAIAKRVALNRLSTTVASHVGNLKRDLGKRRTKKATPTPGTPAPLPTIPIPTVIGGLTADEQLQLFLAGDGLFDPFVDLEVHDLIAVVFLREARNLLRLVLPDPRFERVRHADLQNVVPPVAEHVDGGNPSTHGLLRTTSS